MSSHSRCKKSAAFSLKAVARHSGSLAHSVVACRALDRLVTCLEDFDVHVKEGASLAIGCVALHTAELAQQVCTSGASLFLCTPCWISES